MNLLKVEVGLHSIHVRETVIDKRPQIRVISRAEFYTDIELWYLLDRRWTFPTEKNYCPNSVNHCWNLIEQVVASSDRGKSWYSSAPWRNQKNRQLTKERNNNPELQRNFGIHPRLKLKKQSFRHKQRSNCPTVQITFVWEFCNVCSPVWYFCSGFPPLGFPFLSRSWNHDSRNDIRSL